MLELIVSAGLPRPEVNATVAGHEVDFLWRSQRLVLEVDGYAFHHTRAAFEADRRRDAQLQDAGHRVVRTTWQQLTHEPVAVIARLSRALA
jgi:very-short-patch-repair endonuclease